MANLIERKRRRRRKEMIISQACLPAQENGSKLHNQHDVDEMRLQATPIIINREPTLTCLVATVESQEDFSCLHGQEKCESKNGIVKQKSYHCPQQQQQRRRWQQQTARTTNSLTSAIHIMGQIKSRTSSHCPLKSLSLLSLLLLSIAFTFTLSPLPMNLIQLTEASGNTNNNNQQQQQQQQPQQRQMTVAGFGGSGGNSVINAPTQTSTPSSPSNVKARYKTIYACEDTQLTMDCDYGSKINLIRANFGRFSITQCNEQGQLDLQTDCMSPITLRIMSERCQNKQKCSVNATSSIFGDKCPKTRKYLEVHFQCQQDLRNQQPVNNNNNNNNNYEQLDRVDLRNSSLTATPISHIVYPQPSTTTISGSSPVLPPNNPTTTISSSGSSSNNNNFYSRPVSNNIDETSQPVQANTPQSQLQPQQPLTVMNSEIVSYNAIADSRASNNGYNANNNISQSANEQIIVTLRHFHTENMSNPRCVLWDPAATQWTERGSRIVDTNSTHTICAFDQATSYLLVMDYLAPNPTISQMNAPLAGTNQPFYLPPATPQPPVPRFAPPIPRILDFQPVLLDGSTSQQQLQDLTLNNKINQQQQSGPASSTSSLAKFFSLFGYMLAIVFVAIAFITIAFIASTMRTSGTTLKSLGNFTAFGGPKYKNRRADEGLHNKDLLVINNQNGHQFLYAPASTTKISNSSTSTHILPGSLAGQHQGTLHHHIQQQQQQQLQQQQMYSGTNGTLSNLSATGGQSNYYYGLMGSLFQQQQQQQSQLQHHLSTLHLNQQHQQQMQQQGLQAQANYQHQTDKSTISNESANSTPSSSGVESASASLHQQQQQQQQQQHQQPQSCLMMNSEYNLMGQVSNNYNHQTLLSSHHYQPQLTLNAHYSSSGPMNHLGTSQQQQQQQQRFMINNNQLIREHIYESVDDEKQQCMARGMFQAANLADQTEQLFNANTLGQQQMSQASNGNQQANLNRAMTLSSRLLQQQHQQPLINSNQASNTNNNKRLNSQPAIVRDKQTKGNIICSKLAQVTPQRATEINKFQHDIMAIFNGTDTTTTTAASTALSSPSNGQGFNRSDLVGGDLGGGSKVSTDC